MLTTTYRCQQNKGHPWKQVKFRKIDEKIENID